MKPWVLLSEFFPPAYGGIQGALQTLVQNSGPELTVITPPQPGDQDFDNRQKYKVIRRSLFHGRQRPSWWWLCGWLWKKRPSLTVFGHYSAAVSAAWLLRFFGRRYALFVHGQDVLSEARKPGRRWLVKAGFMRAEWIGVNSRFMEKIVHELNVPRSRIVRTHPAVSDEFLDLVSHPEPYRMVTVSRLVPRKNVAQVIQAVDKLRADFPDVQYEILGDGPERSSLEHVVRSLGIQENVHFHGHVSNSEKKNWLTRARVFVLAPIIREQGSDVEGLGTVYLEAAAAGLPIIASATGGIPDIVRDRENGIMVDPHSVTEITEALRELFTHQEQAHRLGQAGRQMIQTEFTDQIRNHRFQVLLNSSVSQATVSVVIPVFNHARTIGKTLQALFRQTWKHCEVIVVNDGSTDRLIEALQPWRSRITFVEQPNLGAPAARNAGATKAQGDYLLFLDADTWLHPAMIESMVQVLETHPDASFVYSRFHFGPKGFRLHEYSKEKLRRRNFIHTTSLLRRKDFPGFDPNLKRFQDWDLWLTLVEQGKTGVFLPRELFRVSQGQGGMRASAWVPRFIYRLPGIGQGRGSARIRRYREAEQIIRQKHGLS